MPEHAKPELQRPNEVARFYVIKSTLCPEMGKAEVVGTASDSGSNRPTPLPFRAALTVSYRTYRVGVRQVVFDRQRGRGRLAVSTALPRCLKMTRISSAEATDLNDSCRLIDR